VGNILKISKRVPKLENPEKMAFPIDCVHRPYNSAALPRTRAASDMMSRAKQESKLSLG